MEDDTVTKSSDWNQVWGTLKPLLLISIAECASDWGWAHPLSALAHVAVFWSYTLAFCPSVVNKGIFPHEGPTNRTWKGNEHVYLLFKMNFYHVRVEYEKHHLCSREK